MSRIPEGVRSTVRGRDLGRCVRCIVGRRVEAHHRRGRAVADAHQHCPCNLVLLCGWGNHTGDHGWAHTNPLLAQGKGLILSRSITDPSQYPIYWFGQWVALTCTGQVEPTDAPKEKQ